MFVLPFSACVYARTCVWGGGRACLRKCNLLVFSIKMMFRFYKEIQKCDYF